ncbi:Dynein light chain Tctex-type [Leishmania donovani]|uniref:Dynein_light_chain_Tctex-type_putative/GeneDB:Lmj F.18.0730 n=1 Tax=Leishmania donovani TaxID=5661 RepID=A0A6J8F979_LEIDO|nr:Dynein light chain Tctex-type [Leishmania donovani]VDZ43905.1 Dynein_light_chain_Tctex-type_putative/GeneDB:LmjF.18.0730 [Leishmania donovani]
MADHSSENSTAAETVNSDLDATRPGTDAATLRGSSGADETSKNVTTSGQDVPEDQQGSTTAGVADGANGEAAVSAEKATAANTNNDGSGSQEDGEADEDEEEDDAGHWERVAASDVKNIILQVLSPYFDDDVGGGAAAGPGGDLAAIPSASGPSPPAIEEDRDGDDTAQRYDHFKAEEWVALVCDGIMERLVALGKPFKFVVHAMVMRKCGAGVHVCSSCYYAPMDGWLSHAHDLSAHLYAVVTVYWCAV